MSGHGDFPLAMIRMWVDIPPGGYRITQVTIPFPQTSNGLTICTKQLWTRNYRQPRALLLQMSRARTMAQEHCRFLQNLHRRIAPSPDQFTLATCRSVSYFLEWKIPSLSLRFQSNNTHDYPTTDHLSVETSLSVYLCRRHRPDTYFLQTNGPSSSFPGLKDQINKATADREAEEASDHTAVSPAEGQASIAAVSTLQVSR